ncbi:MAG: hypothetical protein ABSC23_16695 [Bryobacteraceae bacterium]|jgi:uncharacterized protein (TIGR03437 family)
MRRVTPLLLAASLAWGVNCSRTGAGFTPFINPYPATYNGQQVSLYPTGNARPPVFEQLGLQLASQVIPRDAAGNSSATGKIVLLSVGMSNTTQEFSAFLPLAQADARKDPHVLAVDGAVSGRTAASIVSQPDTYWSVVDQRLQTAGATGNQVQVIWLKEADADPTATFPIYPQTLQSEMLTVIQQARARFPNLKIVYLSSRIYAGYADTTLNPEPWAYESGFAVKWLIEQQINSAPGMGAASGAFPWLAWGPYLWADGLTPRIDGLTWACSELQADGTHPSPAGQQKVAAMLLDFFHSDSTARVWYLARQSDPQPTIAAVVNSAGWATPMATGSLAAIFGLNLASAAVPASANLLPHDLGGTRVEVDGAPALLYYVSPNQINFVIPPTGGSSLTVVRDDAVSAPLAASFTFWAPGLYTLDSAIAGPLAALHADGSLVTAANPARRGETILALGTGLGYINPALMTPDSGSAIPVLAPTVQVAGRVVDATAVPSPGLPGVTQVKFTLPSDVTADLPGPEATVVFLFGSTFASNKATLALGN